jgi:hypothetical protein
MLILIYAICARAGHVPICYATTKVHRTRDSDCTALLERLDNCNVEIVEITVEYCGSLIPNMNEFSIDMLLCKKPCFSIQ